MRARFPLILLLAALAAAWTLRAGDGSGIAAPRFVDRFTQQSSGAVEVDVELVLAVDISFSMDPDEQALQREGYIHAITSREFLSALRDGVHGKIAMTYFEWANANEQRIIVPWRLIDGPEAADAFADEIARAYYRRASRTSISGALEFGAALFDNSGYKGLRRVIDISGDGANNNGALLAPMRDEVVAKGIVINGLPIMVKVPLGSGMDIGELDVYYEDCVIGGPGAFLIPIKNRGEFKEATRRKLVQEIASRPPPPRLMQASAAAPRIRCTIGEEIWQQRWGN
ncbi:MAG: DUF1194 domain-containing protein [Xanthobacteraceae bacterium]